MTFAELLNDRTPGWSPPQIDDARRGPDALPPARGHGVRARHRTARRDGRRPHRARLRMLRPRRELRIRAGPLRGLRGVCRTCADAGGPRCAAPRCRPGRRLQLPDADRAERAMRAGMPCISPSSSMQPGSRSRSATFPSAAGMLRRTSRHDADRRHRRRRVSNPRRAARVRRHADVGPHDGRRGRANRRAACAGWASPTPTGACGTLIRDVLTPVVIGLDALRPAPRLAGNGGRDPEPRAARHRRRRRSRRSTSRSGISSPAWPASHCIVTSAPPATRCRSTGAEDSPRSLTTSCARNSADGYTSKEFPG